jgi:hypothetical protein
MISLGLTCLQLGSGVAFLGDLASLRHSDAGGWVPVCGKLASGSDING